MSRRTWPLARRYALLPLAVGGTLLVTSRRSGWALVGLAAAIVAFFRDPERPAPAVSGVAYAAADGVVTEVEAEVDEPWLPGGRGARVTVFLSLADVHVGRSPVRGRVRCLERRGEGAAPALLRRAGENRRLRLLLDGPEGPVVVVLVAGAIARTVTSWVDEGDEVAAGQRLGLVHFGSRADVLLPPASAQIVVSRGHRVRAGVTPLARLPGSRP